MKSWQLSLIDSFVPEGLQSPRVRRAIQMRHVQERVAQVTRYAPLRWGAAAVAGYALYKLIQRLREDDLSGQVVLITGGSRGLGFLLAHEFAREGCRVAICGRDPETLERARRELEHCGADVAAVQCDVCNPDNVRTMVEWVTTRFGRIDILVNNAGIIQVGPVEVVQEQDFHDAMEVMFWGPLRTTQAVLPQMRARGYGRIVNITSIGGMMSVPHLLPYTCAKFASVGLSQGLRAELARQGIRVTTIVPGLMRVGSHLNAEFLGDSKREYQWFALGATLPLASMKAERAARQVVQATKRGDALRTLGMPAAIAERIHGLLPGTVARIMSVVNRLLPDLLHSETLTARRGWEAAEQLRSLLFNAVTSGGVSAAERTNQFRGPRM